MQQNKEQFTPDLLMNKVIDRNGKLGKDACEIITSAIRAVDPYQCVIRNISDHTDFFKIGNRTIQKSAFDRIIVIGMGKASVAMAKGVIDIFKEKIEYGAVVTKDNRFESEDGYGGVLKVYIGGHPIPTAASVNSTKLMLSQLPALTSRDLVIVLISGGGSALFTLPVPGISLDDIQCMTELLLKSGADINEINTLRKRLDQVKGGGLAKLLHPAQIHTLILSDVIGDPLDMIASGPTVPDPSDIKDAFKIIEKYQLGNKLPRSVLLHLQKERKKKCPDLEISEPVNDVKTNHIVIGSIFTSAWAALDRANALGYNSQIISTHLTGNTQHVAEFIGGIIDSEEVHRVPMQKPACLIFGGETTVKVTGDGLGGRNQDLSLHMVQRMAGKRKLLFISFATDGEDGPTDAAGGAVDGFLYNDGASGKQLEINQFIANNDAYHYLEQVGALIKTGATGTNVNDLIIVVME